MTNTQPRWPTPRYMLRELRFYLIGAVVAGVGFVIGFFIVAVIRSYLS